MIEVVGETTSIDVINDLVSLAGQDVLDIGCGDMTFSRLLAENGARVVAVDPDAAQAELNRAADPISNIEFVEADVRRPDVEAAFERLGAPDYRFKSPKQMMFLRTLKS